MAGLKITFLIIGAFLLAAQVNSKAVNDEGQVGKINFKEDNIIDQVAEIVNFLKSKTILGQELIEHILLKAGDVIKVITYNYDGFQNKVVDHARNKTTQSLERVNKVLNEVNKQSSAEVQKYIGCVTSQESDVADIAANLVLNFTTCTKNALSLLAIDLTPLVKVLSSTSKKMKAIADDLDNSCPGTSVFTVACLSQKLYEIFSVFNKDLPLIVVRSTSVLIVDLPFLQNSAAKCMKSSVPDVLAEFGKVVNSIASCNK